MMPCCTQNNGHIGPLFGSWHLESMTCDGEIKPQPEGTDTYWSFQGQVLNVLLVETMYESLFYIATWERENDCLALDFTTAAIHMNREPAFTELHTGWASRKTKY